MVTEARGLWRLEGGVGGLYQERDRGEFEILQTQDDEPDRFAGALWSAFSPGKPRKPETGEARAELEEEAAQGSMNARRT